LGLVVAVALTVSPVPQVQLVAESDVDGVVTIKVEGGGEGDPVSPGALLLPCLSAARETLEGARDVAPRSTTLAAPHVARRYAHWMRTVRGAQAPPDSRRAAG
jgi:hypothetical protein